VDCCSTSNDKSNIHICPYCNNAGKKIKIITLKSLLVPEALTHLQAETSYAFCPTPDCEVVYFNPNGQIFTKTNLKVPVFQKELQRDTPICYCFGWTKQKIQEDLQHKQNTRAIEEITVHINANRCGCEVNNPQGSCCLGNVQTYVKSIESLRIL
jgi:hypothetical protein